MIRKIVLKDFLIFEDVEINFEGSTIAMTGENGHGKSSILEAIPYAYYGIGRSPMAGMSRLKGDGSHEVQIYDSEGFMIRRGRRKSGSGFFEVKLEGELIAKGKEADAWVEKKLGMNGDTFMLTAFFGLQDSHQDTLIKVLPSARLEALQKLAEIGPYRKFLDKAKERLRTAKQELETAITKKTTAEALIKDETEISENIDLETTRQTESEEGLLKARARRDALRVREEKYQNLLKERDSIERDRRDKRSEVQGIHDKIEHKQSDLATLTKELDRDIANKKKIVEDALYKLDPEKLRSEVDELNRSIGENDGLANLREMAQDMGGDTCPLCYSTIEPNVSEKWADEAEEMRKNIREWKSRKQDITGQIRSHTSLVETLEGVVANIEQAIKDSEQDRRDIEQLNRDLKVAQAELSKLDTRYVDIEERLGDEFQGLAAELDETTTNIEFLTGEVASAKTAIDGYKKQQKDIAKGRKVVKDAEEEAKQQRRIVAAMKLLSEAWNRYGIPMRLIQRVMRDIADRASAVYQEFDSGRISVEEVEDRGKPGVEFFLVDRSGKRTFNQLSKGEKVMFFISVRVAIAQIIGETRPISVDYLILDEAMGNLSPKRRDDLVRLINKVLRNLFPQVVMVSHTPMPEIFSQTFRAVKQGASSTVEVV